MRQESMAGRPKPLRVHLREGMEAALKTEPRAFATAEPRTLLGMVIQGLGLEHDLIMLNQIMLQIL